MNIKKFNQQSVFQDFLANDPEIQDHAQFEKELMLRRAEESRFFLDGYCKICQKPTTFLVDRLFGAQSIPQGWEPNWRERLVCAHCQLNSRQRAILHVLIEAIATRNVVENSVSLYAMEQISPLFHWLTQNLNHVHCLGSEYLGEHWEGGGIINGIQHENVEALSFADQHFDFIMSNDVLEHVHLPERALAEMYRVLKPHGEIFITIPFHFSTTQTIRRAAWIHGTLQHLLPPVYHGNPLSEEGALVFNDFGWDFIEQLKITGFQEVALCYYWSYFYGYLHDPQFYFWGRKPNYIYNC